MKKSILTSTLITSLLLGATSFSIMAESESRDLVKLSKKVAQNKKDNIEELSLKIQSAEDDLMAIEIAAQKARDRYNNDYESTLTVSVLSSIAFAIGSIISVKTSDIDKNYERKTSLSGKIIYTATIASAVSAVLATLKLSNTEYEEIEVEINAKRLEIKILKERIENLKM